MCTLLLRRGVEPTPCSTCKIGDPKTPFETYVSLRFERNCYHGDGQKRAANEKQQTIKHTTITHCSLPGSIHRQLILHLCNGLLSFHACQAGACYITLVARLGLRQLECSLLLPPSVRASEERRDVGRTRRMLITMGKNEQRMKSSRRLSTPRLFILASPAQFIVNCSFTFAMTCSQLARAERALVTLLFSLAWVYGSLNARCCFLQVRAPAKRGETLGGGDAC